MIILTGGAGFIGSCFLKKLNDNGINDILLVDHLGEGEKWKNITGKKIRDYVSKKEIDYKLTLFYRDGIDTIIHLGACTNTTETNADYVIDNNFNKSVQLAEYAIEHDIRFIYASSAATYGGGEIGYSDREFDKLKPLNIYGLSKHLFDQWVIANKNRNKFTGLKFFNVFGPNEYHKGEMSSMVYKAYRQIQESGKVHLFKSNSDEYKDGEQKRDFVYVMDVVEILWKIYNDSSFAGIYNVGTGVANTWNDLIYAVFKAMGREPEIEYIDMPESLVNQYQYYTCADMMKLNATKCSVDFSNLDDSVEDYVKNFLMKEWKYY